jgi:hypothetical protein
MSIFKSLSETIANKRFFDVSEIEDLIKTYFEFYQQDAMNDELFKSGIVRRRNLILSKKRNTEIEKHIIEKQLLVAKSKIKEKKEVDKEWMARANLAFRIKKSQILSFENDLTNLRTYEKEKNMKKSSSVNSFLIKELILLITDRLGDEESSSILSKAKELADERYNTLHL